MGWGGGGGGGGGMAMGVPHFYFVSKICKSVGMAVITTQYGRTTFKLLATALTSCTQQL